MALQKYIKKNIEVQAIQFNGSIEQLSELTDKGLKFNSLNDDNTLIKVKTSNGEINATPGDYILFGINGDFTVCKENDFLKLYEKEEHLPEFIPQPSSKKTIFEMIFLGVILVTFISGSSISIYSIINRRNISAIVDICYREKIELESKQLLVKAQLEADEIITTAKKNAKIEADNAFREEMTRITNEKIRGSK